MNLDQSFVDVSDIRHIAAVLEDAGIDVPSLLTDAGLRPDALTAYEALFPMNGLLRLYHEASFLTGGHEFAARLAAATTHRDLGVIGYLLANQPTAIDALQCAARYLTALHTGVLLSADRRGAQWLVTMEVPDGHLGTATWAAAWLGGILNALRKLTGRDIRPTAGFLRADGDPEVFAEAFHAELFLRSTKDELVLEDSDLAAPIVGADPELMRHLLAAAEAAVARRRHQAGVSTRLMHLHGCTVDLVEGVVRRGAELIPLTTKERAILDYFYQRPNEVVTHEELEQDIWGIGRSVISHAPAVAIRRLRAKIEPPRERPVNLVTVFGEGWKLVLDA